MDAETFATRFAQAHQDIYLHAVRRVRDKREQLTRETAERDTLAYMATLPAWRDHPRVKARLQ